jgi:hypothetical protein
MKQRMHNYDVANNARPYSIGARRSVYFHLKCGLDAAGGLAIPFCYSGHFYMCIKVLHLSGWWQASDKQQIAQTRNRVSSIRADFRTALEEQVNQMKDVY